MGGPGSGLQGAGRGGARGARCWEEGRLTGRGGGVEALCAVQVASAAGRHTKLSLGPVDMGAAARLGVSAARAHTNSRYSSLVPVRGHHHGRPRRVGIAHALAMGAAVSSARSVALPTCSSAGAVKAAVAAGDTDAGPMPQPASVAEAVGASAMCTSSPGLPQTEAATCDFVNEPSLPTGESTPAESTPSTAARRPLPSRMV